MHLRVTSVTKHLSLSVMVPMGMCTRGLQARIAVWGQEELLEEVQTKLRLDEQEWDTLENEFLKAYSLLL